MNVMFGVPSREQVLKRGGDHALQAGPEILELERAGGHDLDLLAGPGARRLMKDVGHVDVDRQGRLGDPGLADARPEPQWRRVLP